MPQTFTILPGLPPYGPQALPFPKRGLAAFREGLVVQFTAENGTWTGNFQRGWMSLDKVLQCPDEQHVLVVAGGSGYFVNPDTREADEIVEGIVYTETLHFLNAILIGDLTTFKALGAQGRLWVSPRISWDGFQNLRIEGTEMTGDAYSPISSQWHPFKLDLLSGKCDDSVYEREMSKMVQVVPKRE